MEPVTLAVVSLAVLMLLLSFGVPIVFCFSGALAFMSIVGGVTMKGMMMWGLQQILSPRSVHPLFIYAGSLMTRERHRQSLLRFSDVFVGRIRAGSVSSPPSPAPSSARFPAVPLPGSPPPATC